jgi:hypothetical protein
MFAQDRVKVFKKLRGALRWESALYIYTPMTFQELQIGDYFRIPGLSTAYVYRKASSSHCSLQACLQPIRSKTTVIPLTHAEITNYFSQKFAQKQEFLNSLRK